MNIFLKTTIAGVLDRVGALSLLRSVRAPGNGIILTFHRVLPRAGLAQSYDPHLAMSANVFDALLSLLVSEFDVIPLCDAIRRPGSGARRQRVAITFDDGWQDTYSVALPILRKHGVPATVFLCSELANSAMEGAMLPEERFARVWKFCEAQGGGEMLEEKLRFATSAADNAAPARAWSQKLKSLPMTTRCCLLTELEQMFQVPPAASRSLMTWDEVRALPRQGISLGSHTRRHCTLTSEADEVVLEELAGSQREIVEQTGAAVEYLAYPNGAHDARIMRLARQCGYASGLAVRSQFLSASTDRFSVPRFSMDDLAITGTEQNLSPSRTRMYLQGIAR